MPALAARETPEQLLALKLQTQLLTQKTGTMMGRASPGTLRGALDGLRTLRP